MAGPEYLEDAGPAVRRGRSWAVLAVVVLVVAGLAVVRLGQSGSAPAPGPTVPTSASSSPSRTWPVGIGLPPGTLFLVAEGRVQAIDVGSGLLTSTSVAVDPVDGSLVPVAAGVLVLPHNGRPRQLLFLQYPIGGALRTATAFLPGPDGLVWASKTDASEPADKNTWRLLDLDGQVSATVQITGAAVGDGAGGLLAVGGRRFRRVYPQPRGPRQAGEVVATGPDGYLVRRCVDASCTGVLHDRASDEDHELPGVLTGPVFGGALSPGNRFRALTVSGEGDGTVQVSEVESGAVRRSFGAAGPDGRSLAWLDERWLVLVSEDRLVLYDAATDVVITPDPPLSSITSLVWRPT